MVKTRSQGRSSIPVFMSGMDKHDRTSDTESECSVPEVLSRDQIDELDDGNLIRTNNNSEQRSIDQRFSEMNKQISDLTGLVFALIEKLSSNSGEGNNQSTASDKACARSNKCTGKPYLLKAQHSAFNISDSTTIPLTVQNWQIRSFVPDSTDLVVDSSNKCLAVRTVGMQRCPGFHKNVSFAE